MNINDIFISAIKKWPSKISLENSEVISKTEGFYCPNLSAIWDKIENSTSDEKEELMHWVLFRTFHKIARETFQGNGTFISTQKIKIEDINFHFIKAFKEGGYK